MKKRGIALLLTGALLCASFTLGGCGLGKKSVVATQDKDHVYKVEELNMKTQLDGISNFGVMGDRIYVMGNAWEENKGYTYTLLSMNLDGTDEKVIDFKTGYETYSDDDGVWEEGEGEDIPADDTAAEDDTFIAFTEEDYSDRYSSFDINGVAFGENELIYVACQRYDEYTSPEGEYVSSTMQYLIAFDTDGNKVAEGVLDDGTNPSNYFYVNSMIPLKNGNIAICTGSEMILADGNTCEVTARSPLTGFADFSVYPLKDGSLMAIGWDEGYESQKYAKIDINTMKAESPTNVPENIYRFNFVREGNYYDVLLTDGSDVYSYNFGDAEPVKMMSLTDSDLFCYGLNDAIMINEKDFISNYLEPVSWGQVVATFRKVAPEDVVEKQVIVLAGSYLDSDLRQQVINFNKKSDTYRIQIKDYSTYITGDDLMTRYTQLNNDIIAGNIPDILAIDAMTPFDGYISKGLFMDINELFEKDETLNREDYLENVLDACSVDGKLYSIGFIFTVDSLAGKTSRLNGKTSWNMDEFTSFAASLDEDMDLIYGIDRNSFMSNYLYDNMGNFVNQSTGKVSFDNGEFAKALEFAKANFPENINYDNVDDNFWIQYQRACYDDKAALASVYLSNFSDFARIEQGQFGDDITMIGYPCEEGNGSCISLFSRYAISSRSASTDGAWEFVKYFLSDEAQRKTSYGFPIKKNVFEEKAKESMERPYWENEDGSKEYYDNTYWLGDAEVTINPLTQDEVDEIKTFLMSVTKMSNYSQNIMDIVTEESAPFFAGQKSAEDCANVVQSRVKMYISESR